MFQKYYRLTKPGIVYGNALAAIGGFLLASGRHPRLGAFIAMLIGITGIIAASCVINNYIDRGIDAKMKRTKKRALVTGEISSPVAITFAVALSLIGVASLAFTNLLALGLALLGMLFYVVLYGITKRLSPIGTVVGSVSGAIPPVVGYCAVTNSFDLGALLLFLIMVCWQMPHFYAIAIYRAKEYKAADIPVLPLVKGTQRTKVYILLYTAGFLLASVLLSWFGYAGFSFLIVMTALAVIWLFKGIQGFKIDDDDRWARKMFGFSLYVLLGFCIMIALNPWLP